VTINAQAKPKTRIRSISVAVLALGLIALSGCGSSSNSSSSATTPATPATTASTTSTPAGGSLSLEANREGQLEYSTKSLSAKAGKVNIDFTNTSPVGHNVTVESSSGSTVGATPTFQGGSKTLTVDLKAGTYKFFCTVPGHRMAGMEGTITVK
jgi:plastocyanin